MSDGPAAVLFRAGLQIRRQRIDLMHSLNQMLSRLVGVRIADGQRDQFLVAEAPLGITG